MRCSEQLITLYILHLRELRMAEVDYQDPAVVHDGPKLLAFACVFSVCAWCSVGELPPCPGCHLMVICSGTNSETLCLKKNHQCPPNYFQLLWNDCTLYNIVILFLRLPTINFYTVLFSYRTLKYFRSKTLDLT